MTFRPIAFALCAAATLVSLPAAARPANDRPDADRSVCARNLAGAECGRYQRQLLQATALRVGNRTDAATLRANGQRQLDNLIDSIS